MRTRSQIPLPPPFPVPPVPPPRPPPPPPPPRQQGTGVVAEAAAAAGAHAGQQQHHQPPNDADEGSYDSFEEGFNHDVATQTESTCWILRVRCPRKRQSTDIYLPNIILVEITPRTTPQSLADGLKQALHIDDRIIGLFVEKTGIYRWLENILNDIPSPATTGVVYALHLQQPRPPKQLFSLPPSWVMLLAACLLLLAFVHVRFGQTAPDTILKFVNKLVVGAYHVAIHLPLREVYRQGPWIIGGWEGEDRLERICSRITFHGDESFWARNIGECERIYDAKEEAWLRVARPILVLVLLFFLTLVYLSWQRQKPPPRPVFSASDREAAETYRAFQVILRQVKKL